MQAAPAGKPGRPGPAIGDYALIGDCRTAALVARSGSVDWLCLPDFSSPSVFAAILDGERGGGFSLTPAEDWQAVRSYIGESPVLETVFSTSSGAVRVTDLMVIGDPGDLQPQRELLRIVEGLQGQVSLDARFAPRPDYARRPPAIRRRGQALVCAWGNEQLLLRSEVPLEIASDGTQAGGPLTLRAGQRVCFSLGYTDGDIGIVLPLGAGAVSRMQRTLEWWTDWTRSCSYDGPYREAVIRSAVTLKLMTFALSGAVVAAPTSSLPEAIGGERNWDYRFCWLRDAALTMRAFLGLGLRSEAEAFLRWLLHATVLSLPELEVVYDVYGRTDLKEEQLGHLSGHRGSSPVRIGNGATGQVQLDIYGGVVAAAAEFAEHGGRLQRDDLKLLADLGETICKRWREADHGIWEIRGKRRQYTFSKVMCWLGLDCLLKLSSMQRLEIDRAAVMREREAIRSTIETRGFCDPPGSYVGVLDEAWLDASLLLMGCLGYSAPGSERMRATLDRILERLGRNGLIYRYEPGSDGFDSREGAFGLCSFWAIDNLAKRGDVEQAERLFRHLLDHANDLALFSEEIDPDTGELLGNFPQAFTHVGLINAALAIAGAKGGAGA